jgi:hypothetical protein
LFTFPHYHEILVSLAWIPENGDVHRVTLRIERVEADPILGLCLNAIFRIA